MKETGYNIQQQKKNKSFLKWFNELRDRYRIQYSVTLAVLASLTFILTKLIPPFKNFINEHNIIPYATFLILIDLAITIYTIQRPPCTTLAENQDESMQNLIDAVKDGKTESIDLLEYAGATTLPLIRAIQRKGTQFRLLVKHPETLSGVQKSRSITTLDTFYNSVFSNNENNFEIRCYRLPFTLKGRRIGMEILEIGWLTPDMKGESAYGHENPSILIDLKVRENEYLLSFFTKTFNDYWFDKNTENGFDVLQKFRTSVTY
jgi:hypothetical protein